MAAILDVQGAFDSVCYDILLAKLAEMDTAASRTWAQCALENSLEIVDRELIQLGLELSTFKSRFMHFNLGGLLPGESSIIYAMR